MSNKKQRQRGSRTHGGGTHKNRRGAGHRGGRGNAGRKKHEFHKHAPLGKHGFTRPPVVRTEVREIDLRTLDENAPLYAAEGLAEETADGYEFDVRDVVEDGHDVDLVKVLGTGQVRHRLALVADDFSDRAKERIEAEGGEATISERGERAKSDDTDDEDVEA